MPKNIWLKPMTFILTAFLLPSLSFAASETAKKCTFLLYDSSPPAIVLNSEESLLAFYMLTREQQFELWEAHRTPQPSFIATAVRNGLNRQGQKRDAGIRAQNLSWSATAPVELTQAKTHLEKAKYVMGQLKVATKESLVSRITGATEKMDATLLFRYLETPVLNVMLSSYLADYGKFLSVRKLGLTSLRTATEWKDSEFFFQTINEVVRRANDRNDQVRSDVELLIENIYTTFPRDLVASTANNLVDPDKGAYIEVSLGQQIIQLFAKSYSSVAATLAKQHLKVLGQLVGTGVQIAEGQLLFVQAGLNLDNPFVIEELYKSGYSTLVENPSRRVSTTIRVNGEIVLAKSLQEYYGQKLKILGNQLRNAESRGDQADIEALSKQSLKVSVLAAHFRRIGLIPTSTP